MKTELLVCALYVSAIIFINGCASVPEGSSAAREQSLQFVPPSGKAGVYIIRKDMMSGAVKNLAVLVDGPNYGVFRNKISYPYCILSTRSYQYCTVTPGRHHISLCDLLQNTDSTVQFIPAKLLHSTDVDVSKLSDIEILNAWIKGARFTDANGNEIKSFQNSPKGQPPGIYGVKSELSTIITLEPECHLDFDAEAGRNYYIVEGLTFDRNKLVSEDKGQELVRACKLSGASNFSQ